MDRTDKFEKGKIYKAATNKVVTNVYMDAFPIEKVRFQNAEFGNENKSISCYIDFSTISRLAADVASGRVFKKMDEDQYHRYTISRGGTTQGEHGPISRVMYLGRSGDKIFINMSEGPGKLSETGAIMPDGKPTKEVSVGMNIDDFREMIIYTHDCVCAYLGPMVHKLVRELEEDRKNNSN